MENTVTPTAEETKEQAAPTLERIAELNSLDKEFLDYTKGNLSVNPEASFKWLDDWSERRFGIRGEKGTAWLGNRKEYPNPNAYADALTGLVTRGYEAIATPEYNAYIAAEKSGNREEMIKLAGIPLTKRGEYVSADGLPIGSQDIPKTDEEIDNELKEYGKKIKLQNFSAHFLTFADDFTPDEKEIVYASLRYGDGLPAEKEADYLAVWRDNPEKAARLHYLVELSRKNESAWMRDNLVHPFVTGAKNIYYGLADEVYDITEFQTLISNMKDIVKSNGERRMWNDAERATYRTLVETESKNPFAGRIERMGLGPREIVDGMCAKRMAREALPREEQLKRRKEELMLRLATSHKPYDNYNPVSNAISGAIGTIPYMAVAAVPYVGVAINTLAQFGNVRNDIILNGGNPDDAAAAQLLLAMGWSAIEKQQFLTFAKPLTGLQKKAILDRIAQTAWKNGKLGALGSAIRQGAPEFVAKTFAECVEEGLQGAVEGGTKQWWMPEEKGGGDWAKTISAALTQGGKDFVESIGTMGLLSLVGGGLNQTQARRNALSVESLVDYGGKRLQVMNILTGRVKEMVDEKNIPANAQKMHNEVVQMWETHKGNAVAALDEMREKYGLTDDQARTIGDYLDLRSTLLNIARTSKTDKEATAIAAFAGGAYRVGQTTGMGDTAYDVTALFRMISPNITVEDIEVDDKTKAPVASPAVENLRQERDAAVKRVKEAKAGSQRKAAERELRRVNKRLKAAEAKENAVSYPKMTMRRVTIPVGKNGETRSFVIREDNEAPDIHSAGYAQSAVDAVRGAEGLKAGEKVSLQEFKALPLEQKLNIAVTQEQYMAMSNDERAEYVSHFGLGGSGSFALIDNKGKEIFNSDAIVSLFRGKVGTPGARIGGNWSLAHEYTHGVVRFLRDIGAIDESTVALMRRLFGEPTSSNELWNEEAMANGFAEFLRGEFDFRRLTPEERREAMGFFERVWDIIKDFFRRIFGKEIDEPPVVANLRKEAERAVFNAIRNGDLSGLDQYAGIEFEEEKREEIAEDAREATSKPSEEKTTNEPPKSKERAPTASTPSNTAKDAPKEPVKAETAATPAATTDVAAVVEQIEKPIATAANLPARTNTKMTIFTPGNEMEIECEMMWAPLAELAESTDDREVLMRDRSRRATDEQVHTKTRKGVFQPLALFPGKKSDDGAPIVGGGMKIISGHGRKRMLEQLASEGRFNEYLSAINAEAQRQGVPTAPEGMKNPVLVLRVTGGLDKKSDLNRFAELSNRWGGLERSGAELAAQRAKGESGVRFSIASPVERSKNLIALHNLKPSDLAAAAELEGMPAPSIAVVKDTMGHDNYGPISFVFGAGIIDPKADRNNKIYSSDAWTPTRGSVNIEYKVLDEKLDEIIASLINAGDENYKKLLKAFSERGSLGDIAENAIAAGEYYRLYHNDAILLSYLNSKGQSVPLSYREQAISHNYSNAVVKGVSDAVGDKIAEIWENGGKTGDEDAIERMSEIMRPAAVKAKDDENPEGAAERRAKGVPTLGERLYGAALKRPWDLAKAVMQYREHGITEEIDTFAVSKTMSEMLSTDDSAYQEWVRSTFAPAVGAKGIRNKRELFTPSGSRRSWEALHDEVTAQRIVDMMYHNSKEVGGDGFGGYNPEGAAVRTYASITEMRRDRDRLQAMPEEEWDKLRDETRKEFMDAVSSLQSKQKHFYSDNPFVELDSIQDIVLQAWIAAKGDKEKYLANCKDELHVYDESDCGDIWDVMMRLRNAPTKYFEAKPERVVGFDEVAFAVIPDDSSAETVDILKTRGIETHTYKAEDKEDRLRVLNEAANANNIRFSVGGVYTGSAADYEKPSLHYVGSGEGAQVYGWGLYGSTVRGVAEGYASTDAIRKQADKEGAHILIDGERYDAAQMSDNPENAIAAALDWVGGDFDRVEQQLRDFAEDESISEDEAQQAIDLFLSKKSEIKFVPQPSKSSIQEHLYEQTFFTDRAPGDESHLLKWYEPVSEEMQNRLLESAVKEGKASKSGKYFFIGENTMFESGTRQTGEELYLLFRNMLGSPKAASEWLAGHDIDGVKYPVDSYGGKTVKDGDEAGWNYVSFRDDNIRVDHKWVDGEQRFSIRTRLYNPETAVTVVDGSNEPDFLNLTTAEIRNYLRDKYVDREVEIDSDGTLVLFTGKGLNSALKKRGKHKRVLHVLDELVKNSHYTRFEPNDGQEKHSHLIGQFVYTAAIRLSDGVYGVELKLDIPKSDPEGTHFKGQTVKTKIADAVLSVRRADGVERTSTDEASAAETIRLGEIVSTPQIIPQSGGDAQTRFSIGGIYTGSAADYEKPSLHYVGSGEGAQVYGWGLYGSTVRGVAEGYASTDAIRKRWLLGGRNDKLFDKYKKAYDDEFNKAAAMSRRNNEALRNLGRGDVRDDPNWIRDRTAAMDDAGLPGLQVRPEGRIPEGAGSDLDSRGDSQRLSDARGIERHHVRRGRTTRNIDDTLTSYVAAQIMGGTDVTIEDMRKIVNSASGSTRAADILERAKTLANDNRAKAVAKAASSAAELSHRLGDMLETDRLNKALSDAVTMGAKAANPETGRKLQQAIERKRIRDLQAAEGFTAAEIMAELPISLADGVLATAELERTPEELARIEEAKKKREEERQKALETEEGAEELADPETPMRDPTEAERKAVDDLLDRARMRDDLAKQEEERKRAEKAKRDAEEAEGGESDAGDDAADDMPLLPEETVRRIAPVFESADVFSWFIIELTSDKTLEKHPELPTTGEMWKSPVAVRELKKTAADILRRLAKDTLGSPSINYARNLVDRAINELESDLETKTFNSVRHKIAHIYEMIWDNAHRITKNELMKELEKTISKLTQKGRFSYTQEEMDRDIPAKIERWAKWVLKYARMGEAKLQEEIANLEKLTSENPAGEDGKMPTPVELAEAADKLAVAKVYGHIKGKTIGQMRDLIDQIAAKLDGERQAFELRRAKIEEANKTIVDALVNALTQGKTNRRNKAKAKGIIDRAMESMISSIDQQMVDLVRFCTDPELRKKALEAIDELTILINEGGNRYRNTLATAQEEIHDGLKACYGDAAKGIRHLHEKLPPEIVEQFFRQSSDQKRTYGHLLQLYASCLQRDYAENIHKHGRDEQIAAMEAALTAQDKMFHTWAVNWYKHNRQALSDAVEEVTGLPVIAPDDLYVPVRVETEPSGIPAEVVAWSPVPRALSRRVRHGLDFDENAHFLTMLNEQAEIRAQTIGYAMTGIILRDTIASRDVQTAARRNASPSDMNTVILHLRDILAQGAGQEKSVLESLKVLRKWAARFNIAWNPSSVLAQPASIPVWANVLLDGEAWGATSVLKAMASAATEEGRTAIAELRASDGYRARYALGWSEEVANVYANPNEPKFLSKLGAAYDKGMMLSQFTDAACSLWIAQGFYRHATDVFVRRGETIEEAKRKALALTWAAVEQTQQSGRIENLSALQRGKGKNIINAILQFKTAQVLQNSYIIRAIRDVQAGVPGAKGRLARAIFISTVWVPGYLSLKGALWALIMGVKPEPDDEEEMPLWFREMLYSAVDGLTAPLFVTSTMAEAPLRKMLNLKSYGSSTGIAALDTWSKLGMDVYRMMTDPIMLEEELTSEKIIDDIWKVVGDVSAPIRHARRAYNNWSEE